jgi:hypothetical protein
LTTTTSSTGIFFLLFLGVVGDFGVDSERDFAPGFSRCLIDGDSLEENTSKGADDGNFEEAVRDDFPFPSVCETVAFLLLLVNPFRKNDIPQDRYLQNPKQQQTVLETVSKMSNMPESMGSKVGAESISYGTIYGICCFKGLM